jgi:putative transposase
MARPARFILPGVAVHAIQRGNNRASCFRGAGDYAAYLSSLRELSAKFECTVHAYCLMTNHTHLLLTPPSPEALTGMMRELGQRYVRYFNHRYLRTGTLWEGRFRSCVAETARYVIACYRYIELNPVRAGIANQPDSYPWSSHKANVGLGGDSIISPHPEFLALGTNLEARVKAYVELFRDALEPELLGEIRKATHTGRRLGSGPGS